MLSRKGDTVEELTPELLSLLGSPDPQLRDDVAYLIFAYWIDRDKHYTADNLRNLISTLTNNLHEKIGERGTNSVLLRSFSALTLSVIAYYDVREQTLTDSDSHSLLDSALEYLIAEQDIRGYVPEIGWCHATAHTADLLKFIARNPKTEKEDLSRILDAIVEKLTQPAEHVYVHDENERLTLVTIEILKRDTISFEMWKEWLVKFISWKQQAPAGGQFNPTIHASYQNCKSFLRSLYFTFQAIVDEEEELGAAYEQAKRLLPESLKAVHAFGTGTIYAP